MMKVIVSKEARKDLLSIRRYIHDVPDNPEDARHTMAALKKSIRSLADFSNRGRPPDAIMSVHTAYRYLISKNYCIFYLADAQEVLVVHILDQRQECLRALLGGH